MRRQDDLVERTILQGVSDGQDGVLVADLAIRVRPELPEPGQGEVEPLPGDGLAFSFDPGELLPGRGRRNHDVEPAGPIGHELAYPFDQVLTAEGLVGHHQIALHAAPPCWRSPPPYS